MKITRVNDVYHINDVDTNVVNDVNDINRVNGVKNSPVGQVKCRDGKFCIQIGSYWP